MHLLFYCSGLGQCFAQTESTNLEFIENKGQWDSRVILKAQISATEVYFWTKRDLRSCFIIHRNWPVTVNPIPTSASGRYQRKGRLRLPGELITAGPKALRSHAYAVNFLHMNEATEIIPDKPLDTYNNYFIGNDSTKWARNCRIFQGVTYKNIYPGIDLRYYTANGKLKYDIIVHPGADPRKYCIAI